MVLINLILTLKDRTLLCGQFMEIFPTGASAEVIPSAKKKKISFFTIIGRDAYKVAQTLCSPKVPGEYNYNELVT